MGGSTHFYREGSMQAWVCKLLWERTEWEKTAEKVASLLVPGDFLPEQQELWCDLERARFMVCSAACCKVAFKAVRKAALHLQSGTASAATEASCTLLREKNCFDLFCNHLLHVNLLCCCLKQMPFLAYYSFLSLLLTGLCHSRSRVTIEITIKQNLPTNPTLWKPFTRRVAGVLELSYSYLFLMYAHTFFCICLK